MTDIRDSQVVAKTLATNPADIRDSQVVAKTLATNPADIRDSQVVAKALVENPATIRDSQVVAKALVENPADIRDSQVLIKVLHSTAIAINLVAGTYTISGTDAALQRGVQLACDAGVYVINGTDASLERPNSLQADPGVYVITGTPVTLTAARTLSADGGIYDLHGINNCLRVSRRSGRRDVFCDCCGLPCDYVSGLFGTGISDATTPCEEFPFPPPGSGLVDWEIDKYWQADGHEAYLVREQPNAPGCPFGPDVYIAHNCDPVLEPGGPNGAEVVFSTSFEIAAGAPIDCIVLEGRFSADNYIKSGAWKVNGIDQAHINHGSYDVNLGNVCVYFRITGQQGGLLVGTNTIEITVKNGFVGSGSFGGPMGLYLEIFCQYLDGPSSLPEPPLGAMPVPRTEGREMRTAKPVANRFDSGIGTRLERIIHEKTGIKPCPYCRSQTKRLNTMSPEQATLEIDKIVSGIIKNKWYVRVVDILMPGIATGVIEGWVREAIGNDTQVP